MDTQAVDWSTPTAGPSNSRAATSTEKLPSRQGLVLSTDALALARSLLDAQPACLALLDEHGVVLLANRAWRSSADGDRCLAGVCEGAVFLTAIGAPADFATGLRTVLAGSQDEFVHPARPGTGKSQSACRWRTTTVVHNDHRLALVALESDRQAEAAEAAQRDAEAEVELQRLRREVQSLEAMAHLPHASVTATSFGAAKLSDTVPDLFAELTAQYASLLDMALEEQHYKVRHDLSERLRSFSARLGKVGAGPRDAVEIHKAALSSRQAGAAAPRARAYLNEGRLLLLELMGDLVSYYRLFSLGTGRADSQFAPGKSAAKGAQNG